MTYPYLHFFNIQYWYCVIISLFGSRCTDVQLAAAGLPTTGSSDLSGTGASYTPGFWEWLFGGVHSASSVSSVSDGGVAAATHAGFLASVFAGIGTAIGVLWALFSILAYMLSFLLLIAIVVSVAGLWLVRIEEQGRYGNLGPASKKAHPLRARWNALLEGAMSADPKRWREGISGADEMLGELFSRLGYQGATTSEQIAHVPEGAFANLSAAWEAHRIRNFVFAPTSHFILTQREAFRVMKLYERVFREFDFI